VSAGATGLAARIDALLPQTQCGQCGYPGCRPYAEAIANGTADIDRCPPGGTATLLELAHVLGRDPGTLAVPPQEQAVVAHIDEDECIGCLKCVRACPVDAILGAAGRMHTVLPQYCTGCGLCVAPCPVDCIDLVPATTRSGIRGWCWPRPATPA
jgi:electron transport complex protein RnfB